jgi:hypothetical protein
MSGGVGPCEDLHAEEPDDFSPVGSGGGSGAPLGSGVGGTTCGPLRGWLQQLLAWPLQLGRRSPRRNGGRCHPARHTGRQPNLWLQRRGSEPRSPGRRRLQKRRAAHATLAVQGRGDDIGTDQGHASGGV